jgi:hypothetical protein
MPSVGRIKQLSVLGLTAAAFAVPASSASAADVWLWACHGPGGNALSDLGTKTTPRATSGCKTTGGGFADGVKVFGTGSSDAVRQFGVPNNTVLREVRIGRQTNLVEGQSYALSQGGNTLESRDAEDTPFNGAATFPGAEQSLAPDAPLNFSVNCDGECTTPAGGSGVSLQYIAMRVSDDTAPTGNVGGWTDPASGTLNLQVQASDAGVGLKSATAFLNGTPGPSVSFVAKPLPEGQQRPAEDNEKCEDLTPSDPSIDLAYGAVGQDDDVNDGPIECLNRGTAIVPVDTKSVPDGKNYTIRVEVTDWAGNTTVVMPETPTEVLNNVNLGTNTQDLQIGTAGIVTQQPSTQTPGGSSGGVAGAIAQQCRSPRLSMLLAERPLRVRRGTPILKIGKRYRFAGRLTCVINGRRRSAPKRTRIDFFNDLGRRTIEKPGTTVYSKGRIRFIVAYRTSRTLIFRFTNSDGQRSQVRIRIRVARR